jgi:hypothetical protein
MVVQSDGPIKGANMKPIRFHTRRSTRIVGIATVAALLIPLRLGPPTVANGRDCQGVHAGPPPSYGGDPVIGETEQSYVARTGDHLPSHWLV